MKLRYHFGYTFETLKYVSCTAQQFVDARCRRRCTYSGYASPKRAGHSDALQDYLSSLAAYDIAAYKPDHLLPYKNPCVLSALITRFIRAAIEVLTAPRLVLHDLKHNHSNMTRIFL